MTPLILFVILLATHWLGDFVLQTHWQATNKSKDLNALSAHVLSYTGVLLLAAVFLFGVVPGLMFAGVNGVLHFVTDFCTSRLSAKLYAKGDIHNFFVVVGLDQLIHQTTLALTLWWIVL